MDIVGDRRVELTLRLWRSGSKRQFERYVTKLLKLVDRHDGRAERRAREVTAGRSSPDAVLVLSFSSADCVEAYLTDPQRDDLEDLAALAVGRSLITGSRTRDAHQHEPLDVADLPLRLG